MMALVEIEAGPHLVTAAITRDAVEELGLAPGVPATAAVKATSVMVDRGTRSDPGGGTASGVGGGAGRVWRRRRRSSDEPRLTVSAATSLTNAFEEYGQEFDDATARFTFAGSDEGAAQIRQGVKPDVYAAANTKLPDQFSRKALSRNRSSSPATAW